MADGGSAAAQGEQKSGEGAQARHISEATRAVVTAARAAQLASGDLTCARAEALDEALRAMAGRLRGRAAPVLAANREDVREAQAAGMSGPLTDRLRLDEDRLRAMSGQLLELSRVPAEPSRRPVRELPGDLVLEEWRRPVGVIGANFEARPNIVIDIASQFLKSRNAGVLRTGSAARRSAAALADEVITPTLRETGLNPDVIQLVREPGQLAAYALVSQPRLVPLVILRGSGASTRALAAEAARHGVRTLAHADGGAVIYIDDSANRALTARLIEASLDRLGVCNRLNLLLVKRNIWDEMVPYITGVARPLGVRVSLPPHEHPLGHEWALDTGREATITMAPANDAGDAAVIANRETSGLAGAVVAEESSAAWAFLSAYAGTGAFWNSTPRLLDGFRLLSVPETGINIDPVPGPRGPVTFRDLYLRQFAVRPKAMSLAGLAPDPGGP